MFKLAVKSYNINDNCCTQVATYLSRAMSSEWRGTIFTFIPWGILPTMTYTGKLRPKGAPFSGFRGKKDRDFTS